MMTDANAAINYQKKDLKTFSGFERDIGISPCAIYVLLYFIVSKMDRGINNHFILTESKLVN